MKTFRILIRNIRDSFKSVIRNFSLSLASISSITITLLVVMISLVITYNVNNFTVMVEKDVTIVAFLDSKIEPSEIEVVRQKIENIENVDIHSLKFKSKQETLEEMKASSETYEQIMNNWDENENPLQDTFQVKVNSIDHIGETAETIKGFEGVDVVKYGEGMIEKLVSFFDVVKQISIVVVIMLIVVTAFLISNTIKITIYSRKKEIEIMRLVGASNINIKIPFIFEGMVLGLLGSIIPILTTIFGYSKLYNNFDGQLFSPFIKLVEPVPFVFNVAVILLGIGILVGMFGSARAVRKYLKI
jgi:cell division transport system permease protein